MNKKPVLFFLYLMFSLATTITFAQAPIPVPERAPTTIFGCGPGMPISRCILTVFANVMRIVLFIALIAAIGYIIWAGFEYIRSGSDEDRKKARGRILFAIFGLVIIFLAQALVLIVQSFITRQEI